MNSFRPRSGHEGRFFVSARHGIYAGYGRFIYHVAVTEWRPAPLLPLRNIRRPSDRLSVGILCPAARGMPTLLLRYRRCFERRCRGLGRAAQGVRRVWVRRYRRRGFCRAVGRLERSSNIATIGSGCRPRSTKLGSDSLCMRRPWVGRCRCRRVATASEEAITPGSGSLVRERFLGIGRRLLRNGGSSRG